jgi:hypothetical protein
VDIYPFAKEKKRGKARHTNPYGTNATHTNRNLKAFDYSNIG